VGGLQQPPITSHVGGTLPPETRRAQTIAPAPLPQHKNGPSVLTLLGVVFVAALGAAGLYAWNTGLIGGRDDPGLPAPDMTADTTRWPRQDETREGFLAGFDTGPCTYATRIDAGPNAGMVAGFAAGTGAFSGLPTAYEEKFGARPTILDSQIAEPQCAVLDLVRGMQGTAQPSLSMQLDVAEIASGEGITGRIADPLNRNIWLVLVSPRGGMFSLNDRLSDSVGGVRTFRFGLTLAAGAPAAPQLLLAIASEQPLATAATALDGTEAADLAPLIAREIAGRDGEGVAALSFVLVTPAPPVIEATDPPALEQDATGPASTDE
jgi:serine/threonine-protein kinase